MKTTRIKAVQVHPVPSTVMSPKGPFPDDLFREPKIVKDYESEYAEDGSNFAPGSTAQNNFSQVKVLVCVSCNERVLETKTGDHICKEE